MYHYTSLKAQAQCLERQGCEQCGVQLHHCQLLWAQAPRLERQWASSAATLCLELARASPRYTREMFDTQLAECEFQPYTINTTSTNTLGMAPLFSQQWEASQPREDCLIGAKQVADYGC